MKIRTHNQSPTISIIQLKCVCIILAIVTTVMSIINWSHELSDVFILCLILLAVSLISLAVLIFSSKSFGPRLLLSASFFCGLVYLLLTGGVAGFSAIWLCLAPPAYMFFLGFTFGTLLSLILAVILGVLFWTPLSYHVSHIYSEVFLIRFPIVYVSCTVLASLQEYLRFTTHNKLAKAKTELEDLSICDGLTGIFNRRYLDKALRDYWNTAQRSSTDLSILMIDIDKFKLYNDNYGHLAGDRALILVAKAISRLAGRTSDVVARYGGEEFVALLPFTDQTGALTISRTIIEAMNDLRIQHEFTGTDNTLLSLSIGSASLFVLEPKSSEALLSYADAALYAAKRGGGCRVVVADRSLIEAHKA